MGVIALALFCSSLFAKPVHALTLGDAALTISVSTISGAILGASTLPFYEDSGAHTKNIFYGAALGAVAGVLISAYSGVKEGSNGDDEEDSAKKIEADRRYALARQMAPEKNTSKARVGQVTAPLVWSPVVDVRF